MNENHNLVYVTVRDESTFAIVDGASMNVIKKIQPGGARDHSWGLGFNPATNRLYVTFTDDGFVRELAVYDATATNATLVQILDAPNAGLDAAGRIGVNPSTNHIFLLGSGSEPRDCA